MYLNTLLQTGLDHVLLVFQPELPEAWRALEALIAADIFLTVHLTLTRDHGADGRATLERVAALGVRNISLSAADSALAGNLPDLSQKASDLGMTLRWDLPVPYSQANPVAAETESDHVPSGAGNAWLYVEPDGDVLPAQGAPGKALGNLLRDDWKKIRP
jgi:MoaA/NifB/PqqE/SkfB family radical SAM enzyme